MKLSLRAFALMTLLLSAIEFVGVDRVAAQPPPPGPQQHWDQPPQNFNPWQSQGFRNGIIGAQRDADNHRKPTPDNRDDFRRPPVPHQYWADYQYGFVQGYKRMADRIYGDQQPVLPAPIARPPAVVPQPGPVQHWAEPPAAYSDWSRRGFQDGQTGARRDADNHRRPDPNNRDEYRSPNVPPEAADAYREGFRRGYEVQVSRMNGQLEGNRWQNAPGGYNDFQRRGFQDGQTGARRDADNHRRPDPNNRDEYRSPNVPPEAVDAYREGFRRGYEVQVSRMNGDRDR